MTALDERPPDTRAVDASTRGGAERFVWWLTVLVLGVVAIVPIVGNVTSVANWDPQFMRDVIERTHRAGGTYYENAIHNKGVLEPFVYDMVRRVWGYDGFWYGISFAVTLVSLWLAYVAARTAQFTGAIRELQIAVAAIVFVHFALSGADYAAVLYARNMNVALLAGAFLLTFSQWPWRDRRRALFSSIATGFLLGVAVQNVLSTAFAVAAVGGAALYVQWQRERDEQPTWNAYWMVAAGAFAVLAPIPWYFLRGSLEEYWSGWWVHARFMSIGTNRSLGAQFALGWDTFVEYYQDRPGIAVLIVAFVLAVLSFWTRMSRIERAFHLALLGWFAGGWLELILNQRYSSHQFAVTSVPTALMGAALLGHAYRLVFAGRTRPKYAYTWPLVATVLAIWLSGPQYFTDALERTSKFTSFSAAAREAEQNRSGSVKTVKAVLDLVSAENDPLLASTDQPWPYLDYHRYAATRFLWVQFLNGEIYLGGQSPDYILPKTDEWFADDMEKSRPVTFIEVEREPPPDTPLASYVNANFTRVFENSAAKVSYRTSIAQAVLDPDTDEVWVPLASDAEQTGWTVQRGRAEWNDNDTDRVADRLRLRLGSCYTLTGSLQVPAGDSIGATFRLHDIDTPEEDVAALTIDGGVVRSATDVLGDADGPALIEELPSGIDSNGPVDFALLVGARAAVLVIDGQIRSAVPLGSDSTNLTVSSERGSLTLANLRLGPPPPGSGC